MYVTLVFDERINSSIADSERDNWYASKFWEIFPPPRSPVHARDEMTNSWRLQNASVRVQLRQRIYVDSRET